MVVSSDLTKDLKVYVISKRFSACIFSGSILTTFLRNKVKIIVSSVFRGVFHASSSEIQFNGLKPFIKLTSGWVTSMENVAALLSHFLLGVNFFIFEQMALFFCQHAQDQCVLLKRTQFEVAPLNTLLYKNNFTFSPYNLVYD